LDSFDSRQPETEDTEVVKLMLKNRMCQGPHMPSVAGLLGQGYNAFIASKGRKAYILSSLVAYPAQQ